MRIFLFSLFLFAPLMGFSQEEGSPENTEVVSTDPSPEQERQLRDWREILYYGISDQRLAVVKRIRSNKDSNAITLLEESFNDEDNSVIKEEIIYTFMDLNHRENTDFWNNIFTQETNLTVLQRAAFAVERMNIPVAEGVYTVLSNNLTNARAMRFNASAVQALGQLKYTDAIPVIQEIATNITNNQDLRGSAVVALGMFQDETLIPLLQGLLTNTGETRLIRRYAALGIGRTENPQAIDILSPIATNEDEEQTVRLNSIAGLGYINGTNIVPTLEELTKSDNVAVRLEAIKSLGRLQSEDSRTILEFKAFNDPEMIVRRESKNALQAMGVDIVQLEEDRKNRNNPNYVPASEENSENTEPATEEATQ